MNNLKEKIQENFISYHKELLQCFSEFIDSISIEDEFNFSYLNFYLLFKNYKEKFYKKLMKESYNFWFYEDFFNKSSKGVFGQLGLDKNEINNLEIQSDREFSLRHKNWLLSIEYEYLDFVKDCNFNLIISDYDINKIKGKKYKNIAMAYDGIFNTLGWRNYLYRIFKNELLEFEIEIKDNDIYAFKKVGDYYFKILIEPNDILDVNKFLGSYGIFYFGLIFSIENESHSLYPPELSALLSESLFRKYSVEYKNASYEEAKIRVYANIKAYCKLINKLLPCIEKILITNN